MKAANKSTKLFFNDDVKNFLPDVAKLILEDEVAAKFVDGAAVHWYTFDQYAALKDYKEKYLKKYTLISTEATNSDGSVQLEYRTDWDRAMHYVHGTIVDFVHGGSTVFLDWSMAGVRDLVTVHDNGTMRLNTPYYTFGQITKYFKPGYSVLTSLNVISPGQQADGVFPAGIEAMAAINPSRTEIVIAVLCDDRHESNATIAELLIELNLGGGRYSTIALKDVEQRSVTTVVLTTDKF
ncbi:hypothetical protein FOZ63_013513 [Perkinsus olseni]|uniref:Glycosyl hydrolase family 30 TIM-barrel domain-containing protein n=1 Tax=Perkinsus olseni TaxID=32597 RepID=A0A7J6SLM1_PEROL|nr:hypothetical protein FOZ63_013513 [Perkinsus olseni]